MYSSRFSVYYYVNDVLTSTLENCTAEQAYREAVPGEAMFPYEGNRWHILLRHAALDRMGNLEAGQSLRVAWQDPHPQGRAFDTERIMIFREPSI